MGKSSTRVIYKQDSQATEEFIVMVDPDQYSKWKNGDTSVPLAQVVETFKIYFSNQGGQGLLTTASNQQLDNVFGTHKDVDVVEHILKHGREQTKSTKSSGGVHHNVRGVGDGGSR
ncbi:hypothetical protein CC1G_09850 [Coprinopsis cinerea okayama7|uniref:Ribosome maturation protein SDO1/SBDS N-terminal domain-containing protein n=1 Tax=Coprinopsis cinerea (strain Okayama-7 / 130 / ATCC MYA-4618 / FGSC 9003) TaxID=240176 RepID=A8P0E0_COPC7|nr:hypothetical protein CC1G_09850 [Coprinopsis cinerea okayama7\|eukprot:XP_001837868.1 hypothetical protein CC1G_09850 [Coprinopsis cinerea okayama7\